MAEICTSNGPPRDRQPHRGHGIVWSEAINPSTIQAKEATTSNNQPTTSAAKKKKKLLGYLQVKAGYAALKKLSKSTTQDHEMADGQTPFPEKILDSDWAEIVVGNLLSYVLRHSTTVRGPTALKTTSKDALVEAVLIFEDFKELHREFKAVNQSNIPLGVVIDDSAPKIYLDLKLHYRKLPETIRTKIERLAFDPANLLKAEQHTENNGDDDGTILEDDTDEEDPRKKSTYPTMLEPFHEAPSGKPTTLLFPVQADRQFH
ncbi:hypothetical protein BG015_007415 [Linnemannia schmuckeri]|uniref:Uncharacterized protein n=1 Tax=Linnemannia schmuckeri TaxID=64567 RepID=A0A9P5RZ69_9FUNG|nr:hypothetical protein BG015_007415 [Linnemannia schmuckeri]